MMIILTLKLNHTMPKVQPHTVDISELSKWRSEEWVVFASSSRERKRIECNLYGGMRVTVAGQVIFEHNQAFSIVEVYNSITDKYIDESTKDFKL